MTYFGFLLRFLVIPILIFLVIIYWDNRRNKPVNGFRNGRAVWVGIAIHVLLAVVYTTPWDNYLVATGVWYYNPDLVTGMVLGYVPIEEYTFFVLETILAGLWWWFLARRVSIPTTTFRPNKPLAYLFTCVLSSIWLISAYLFFFGPAHWTYLSIILFWALPPIIVQVLFGAVILSRNLSLVDRYPRAKRRNMVYFAKSNNRYSVLRHSAARRGRLLFHHECFAHLRADSPAGQHQPGEVRGDQESDTGVEREVEGKSPGTLTRS
jgi:lycopene cyclase domain-containing protein